MEAFEYTISVIVPIYNGEKYLKECLDSLLMQTMPQQNIEVLLINDGSTDLSEAICKEYCYVNDNFILYSKPNEGLSATRNYGIKRAKGKYIAYLDCDDTYSNNTLENVCRFFDEHYEEIDEITIPIVRYQNGKSLPLHFRYKYETKTGIYDLEKFPYVSQTTINIIIKNKREDNVLFKVIPNFRHEDQAYNNDVLSEKMKIGFVKEAEYKYNRNNDTSIINTYMYPYYIFETSTSYYEYIFSKYEIVPRYFQAMLINDLNWKLCEDKLWPFHYSTDAFTKAVNRIKKLINKVDYDVIVNHPNLNNFHIQYWLALKDNCHPVVLPDRDCYRIMVNGNEIYKRNYFEIILHKIRVESGICRMLGFVKSPIYNYIDEKAILYIVKNGVREKFEDLFLSVHSYYKSQYTKTNNFWAFDYSFLVDREIDLYFEVELDGIVYPTRFWCMPIALFDQVKLLSQYVRENVLISLSDNVLRFKKVTNNEKDIIREERTNYYKKSKDILVLRTTAQKYRNSHRVWLYYDAYTVEKDNGYYQFVNDFKYKDDGIEKYYVITNKKTYALLNDEQRIHAIEFGSYMHKILYISAERTFTTFYGFSTISPFKTEKSEADYADLLEFKTIYLQHGVLHAALRTYNAVERCRAEQIVVSSKFEIENYMRNYNYRKSDLIPTGMARYDYIDRKKKPANRILYAPSWRKYLTISQAASQWEVVADKLTESDYFKGILEFINSKELEIFLTENNFEIEVKLHPIIASSSADLFGNTPKRVKIIDTDVQVEDYKLFITDFSSFVFDYACLVRPIIYYVTDYEQFKSGMNHYKELDLPFEKGFGKLVTDSKGAVEEVIRIANNDFECDEVFKNRMKEFYVPLDNCRDKLYRYLTE